MLGSLLYLTISSFQFNSFNKRKDHLSLNESVIKIDLPNSSSYNSYYVKSFNNFKDDYIYRLGNDNLSIDIFSLRNKMILGTIMLAKKIDGFEIVNRNSIYVLESESNIIKKIDSNGTVLEAIDLNNVINDSIQRVIYAYTEQALIIYSDQFIFNIVANVISDSFYQFKTIGIFNKLNSTFRQIAPFPSSMKDGNVRYGFYPYYALWGNKIICSFSCDHKLYLYDLDGSLINDYNCKSKFIDSFNVFDKNKSGDRNYNARIQIESPYYANLIYDGYRALFYRLCLHKQSYLDSNEMVNDYFSRAWSLIIMDDMLNVIDEISFPANIYNFQEILVVKDGLMISMNNDRNPNFNPKVLSYKLLEFNYEND